MDSPLPSMKMIERESAELNGSNYRDNIRQQSTQQTEFEDADLVRSQKEQNQ